jgi:hypothetical protein
MVTNAKMASLDHDDEVLCPVWAYVSTAVRTYSDNFEQVEQHTIIRQIRHLVQVN